MYRLAQLLAIKYKVAAAPDQLEATVRKQLRVLWDYPHKLFNILQACVDAKPHGKHEDEEDKLAMAGHRFCKKVVDIINDLQVRAGSISLGELRDRILELISLIEEHKNIGAVQFGEVAALIGLMVPLRKKHDVKLKNELQGKARTGLSRIFSIAVGISKDLQELEVMSPEKFTMIGKYDIDRELPERFVPQRTQLSIYDIKDFIRQHGAQYGINSFEDWETVVNADPYIKEQLTTVINALNRGQTAHNAVMVQDRISELLRNHQEQVNAKQVHFE